VKVTFGRISGKWTIVPAQDSETGSVTTTINLTVLTTPRRRGLYHETPVQNVTSNPTG
jgi:hypothetical protein